LSADAFLQGFTAKMQTRQDDPANKPLRRAAIPEALKQHIFMLKIAYS